MIQVLEYQSKARIKDRSHDSVVHEGLFRKAKFDAQVQKCFAIYSQGIRQTCFISTPKQLTLYLILFADIWFGTAHFAIDG